MIDLKKNLMLVCVGVIFISFFLPWVAVESPAVGKVSKLLTGKKQAAVGSLSGFNVPILANGDESRFVISVIKIFEPGITHADKKSYLIWLVPLLSVGMLGLSIKFKDEKWVRLVIGVVGVLIFVVATFKIATTDLDKMVLKVNIAYGLWLTFLGYLGIGVLSIMDFLKLNKAK